MEWRLPLLSFARTVPPAGDRLPGAEAVAIEGAGALLRGWWVEPGEAPGGSVVLMHGIAADRGVLVRRAEVLLAHGYAVLLFDGRAHGESGGAATGFGAPEAADAVAAMRFVRDRRPGDAVGVIGISLGGAAALLGRKPLAADALVLEAVYPTFDAAFGNRVRGWFGGRKGAAVEAVAVPVLRRLMPPLLGVRWEELRPIDRIGVVRAPVLVMGGDADRETPLVETEALFGRAPEPKTLVVFPGAGHVDLEAFDPERYWEAVLPFLGRHLRRGQEGDGGS